MNFAEKLKMIRIERNLTQEQLAEMLFVSRQAVSKWESGVGYPETEKLLLFSKELNISLDYLLLDDNKANNSKDKQPKLSVTIPSGKIAITTFDKKNVVSCISVKTTSFLFASKSEPKHILLGIDAVTFWGDHSIILGYYDCIEEIEKEISEISKAIADGDTSYDLKYNVDVELVGVFQQPKIKTPTL